MCFHQDHNFFKAVPHHCRVDIIDTIDKFDIHLFPLQKASTDFFSFTAADRNRKSPRRTSHSLQQRAKAPLAQQKPIKEKAVPVL